MQIFWETLAIRHLYCCKACDTLGSPVAMPISLVQPTRHFIFTRVEDLWLFTKRETSSQISPIKLPLKNIKVFVKINSTDKATRLTTRDDRSIPQGTWRGSAPDTMRLYFLFKHDWGLLNWTLFMIEWKKSTPNWRKISTQVCVKNGYDHGSKRRTCTQFEKPYLYRVTVAWAQAPQLSLPVPLSLGPQI